MATDLPAANPQPEASRRFPRTSSALRQLACRIVAVTAEEARNAAVSAAISGIFWWLSHQ